MALRTVSNTGGNWNAVGAWTGGVVPIAGDTVDFTATSGNLTVNVATVVLAGINFTNYVNTITFTAAITSTGTINLGTGTFTQAGASGLIVSGTATISGTTTWSRTLQFTGASITYTLGSDLTITGAISLSGTTASTFTGNTLNIGGNLTVTTTAIVSGTTAFNLNGTGTWSHTTTGALQNNLTINTAGTITIGNIYYSTGTLTYTSGTILYTGTFFVNGSMTTNTSTMVFSDVLVNATSTITMLSNLNINNFTVGASTSGGAITSSFSAGTFILTVAGNLIMGSTFNGAATLNLPNDITIKNLSTTYQAATNNFTINNNTVYILGNLTTDMNTGFYLTGTSTLVMAGTGTWSLIRGNGIANNLTINTSGKITVTGNVIYSISTLKYISGNVVTKNRTLNLIAATTLIGMNKVNFDRVVVSAGITVTMDEFFSGSPALKSTISCITAGSTYTITFQNNFEKIAKFVKVSGCILTKPLQLLCLTQNAIMGTTNNLNKGIRYVNQSPNGVAKNKPSTLAGTTYLTSGLLADPTMITS